MSNPHAFDRRRFMAGAAASAAALAGQPAHAQAQAAAPAPPAHHAFQLGAVKVIMLLDGGMRIPEAFLPRFFPETDPEDFRRLRELSFAVEGGLHQPVGVYLVDTGRSLVMIDAGGHAAHVPGTGRLVEAMRAAGYRPEQVDTVLLTHVHPEHVQGLIDADGVRLFPNAEVRLTAEEQAFWLDPGAPARVPQGAPFVDAAVRALTPYRDRLRPYPMATRQEVAPGITVVPAAGHTPGHVSYLVSSGSESMLIWGDVTHQTTIQLARPRWRIGIDVDGQAAIASRVRTLDMLATDRILVGGVHLPWPGAGRIIRTAPESFVYVPRPWQLG